MKKIIAAILMFLIIFGGTSCTSNKIPEEESVDESPAMETSVEDTEESKESTEEIETEEEEESLEEELIEEPEEEAFLAENGAILWQDASLEEMLRTALEQPEGDIFPEDLDHVETMVLLGNTHTFINNNNIGYSFNVFYPERNYFLYSVSEDGDMQKPSEPYTEKGEIESLADFQHFANLKELTIFGNKISEIAPLEPLASQLTRLSLGANQVADISPLTNFTSLNDLSLSGNPVIDYTPIENLTSLTTLACSDTLSDLTPIASLTNLEYLDIDSMELTDISPITSLQNLETLGLVWNDEVDYSPLIELPTIERIYFALLDGASFGAGYLHEALPNTEIIPMGY